MRREHLCCLLLLVLGCNTTKASFTTSLANRKVILYESNTSGQRSQLLLYVSDQDRPVRTVSEQDFFIHEDGESLAEDQHAAVGKPPGLYLVILIDASQASEKRLAGYSWGIAYALQGLSIPIHIRLISYGAQITDWSKGFIDQPGEWQKLLEKIAGEAGASISLDDALRFAYSQLEQLPAGPINMNLEGKGPLYNSAILLATGPLDTVQLQHLREEYRHTNLLVMHEGRSEQPSDRSELVAYTPYKPLFRSYAFSANSIYAAERHDLIWQQIDYLTAGVHLLSYQSRFQDGKHNVQVSFDVYGNSGFNFDMDYGRRIIYQVDSQVSPPLMASAALKVGKTASPSPVAALPDDTNASGEQQTAPIEVEEPQGKSSYQLNQTAVPPLLEGERFDINGMPEQWIARGRQKVSLQEASRRWYIQIAAFSNEDSCYDYLAPLSANYKVSLLATKTDTKQYYRCLVGPVNDQQRQLIRTDLIARGYENSFPVRADQLLQ